MSEGALIQSTGAGLQISFTAAAIEAKARALELSGIIGKVVNAQDQTEAVNAQKELTALKRQVEGARKEAKAPLLDAGARIDATCKQFVADLDDEERRLAKLIGDFQALELARARAAEAARLKELAEIERAKQAALAEAKSHEDLERIHARANQEAAALPVPVPTRTNGQIVREDWEIMVTDVWALARNHPLCVKIEPRLSEIRALLDTGASVAGVRAEKIVKSGVRTGRVVSALNV